MIKTIFYIKHVSSEDADIFFAGTPYKEWFTLDNVLYNTSDGALARRINPTNNAVEKVIIYDITDILSTEGIKRRVICGFNS